jgi:hypothetical protein
MSLLETPERLELTGYTAVTLPSEEYSRMFLEQARYSVSLLGFLNLFNLLDQGL